MAEIIAVAYLALSLLATLLLWMVLKASKRSENEYRRTRAESLGYNHLSAPKGNPSISSHRETALFK